MLVARVIEALRREALRLDAGSRASGGFGRAVVPAVASRISVSLFAIGILMPSLFMS